MGTYDHKYPTVHDTQELVFYFAAMYAFSMMLNWNLTFVFHLIDFHPIANIFISMFLSYVIVFFNKAGTA